MVPVSAAEETAALQGQVLEQPNQHKSSLSERAEQPSKGRNIVG